MKNSKNITPVLDMTNEFTQTQRCKQSRSSVQEKADRAIDSAMSIAKKFRNRATYNESIYELMNKNPDKVQVEEVRISSYNPNNPMNGSSSWSKQQMAEHKERSKAKK
jgi:hypothetical protein